MDRIIESLCTQFGKERLLEELPIEERFESFAAYSVINSYFEDEFDPQEFATGGGGDLGIDAAAVIVNGDLLSDAADVREAVRNAGTLDVRFIVIQAKTSMSFDGRTLADLADNLVSLFTNQLGETPINQHVANFKAATEAVYDELPKLSRGLPQLVVRYVTTGLVTGDPHLANKVANARSRLDSTNYFGHVDVALVGARELRDLYQRATTAVSAKFTMEKKISLPKILDVDQAFIGVLPARDLVAAITDPGGGIRKTIFYENVRDFQDYNPVNKAIQSTLRDQVRRDRFSVLNNGVTIVTREMTTAGDDIHISDFQIVNGCQTCHVLFDERDQLNESIFVTVKLVQSQDDDVMAGITSATNRQTAVTDEDLAAQERFHKDLEDFFASYSDESRRLYYERRSRQYAAQAGLEKTRIVTRSQLTRAYAAMFLDEPSRAGRYYKELKETKGAQLFRQGDSAHPYYTSAVSAYRLEWLFRNRRIDRSYTPAKYQLLMGIKTYLLGESALSGSRRQIERHCETILDVMWDQVRAEHLVERLLPAIDGTASAEPEQTLNRDTVRTQRFTERFKAAVLRLRSETRDAG